MAIQVSPSVVVTERNLSDIIPAVSSSVGASVVAAQWGPIKIPTLISSESKLAAIFGKPTDENAGNWFPISQFLTYSGACYVVRVDDTNALNASTGTDQIKIHNQYLFDEESSSVLAAANDNKLYGLFTAKYAGEMGNSIRVEVCDNEAAFATWAYKDMFSAAPKTSDQIASITGNANANDEMHVVVIDTKGIWSGVPNAVVETYAFLSKARNAKKDNNTSNYYATVLNNQSMYIYALPINSAAETLFANSNKPNLTGPAQVEVPSIKVWGTEAVLESPVMSYDRIQGTEIPDPTDPVLNAPTFGPARYEVTMSGGLYNCDAGPAKKQEAFDVYKSAESIDVSLLFLGEADRATVRHVIDTMAESTSFSARKDCVIFISPTKLASNETDIGEIIRDSNPNAVQDLIAFKGGSANGVPASLPSSSYTVYDTGYKYMYDTYNDTYRWVAMNGDIAGLCARTDLTDDPWFSPAGFNRGQIKNAVRLAFNPDQAARDAIYLQGINPVVSFVGQGVVLYGDKTGLSKPSAFDRINVRRLFIILEKAIAEASKYQLFEINDAFTRSNFKNMVEPFLRDVQGRRGIYDFKVVCDTTNNTPEVIDTNRFVGDIYIKPAKSINFIQLNFIATRTGVSFEEAIVANFTGRG